MNKEDLDLSDIINNKIKTEFEQFITADQPPPFYTAEVEKEDDEIKSSAKYHHDYLDDKKGNNEEALTSSELDCKLNKLNSELNVPPPPSSLYADLYGQSLMNNNNVQSSQQNSSMTNYTTSEDLHCLSNLANSHFYQQQNNSDSSSCTTQQSIMMKKVSLLNSGTLKLPSSTYDTHHHHTVDLHQQPKQTIYQQPPLITTTASSLDQQINEIYQYAASDQLSKSTSIDSDAAYSTLKLLDTASCNSSLVGGSLNNNSDQQLIKCYPPTYTQSTANNNVLRLESETDSGYTFSGSQTSRQQQLLNIENDYIQGLKNQISHSPMLINQLHQLNQQMNHQINQLSQQLNSPAECLYQPSSNHFVHSRTAMDLSSDPLDSSTSQHCLKNLNKSLSTYSFVNLRPNQNDEMQYSAHNSYLAYQSPSDITVLSSTPIPGSSTKEAMIQQQLSSMNPTANLVIMTNCAEMAQQTSFSSANSPQDSIWYKLLSRRLRERYISKRKVQDSTFNSQKKSKLDLDSLDDKKAITATEDKSPFRLFYQLFFAQRCSLVPCLLIFACALLVFVIGLFTILTCYFKNPPANLLLNDHQLLTNFHTQLHGNNLGKSFNNLPPGPQQPTMPSTSFAFDIFNKFLLGLTSVVKGVASSSSSGLPNSLTTGAESTINKHTTQTESQLKFKQHQTNQWYRSAIFYEVFVASFQDSDEDGVGDLNGLINRLAYIKELGVTVIRLNSIFSALDYPYQFENVLNYTQIEKKLGNINDFRRLVANCHNLGLRLVLDLNPSVTSDQHRWAAHFLNYHHNKTNDSHNYYVNTSEYVPVNDAFFQTSNFPSASKDQLDETSSLNSGTAYDDVHLNIGGHLFLNYSHPFISNQLIRTIRFWLNEGVDGFYLTRLHEIQFNQENPEHLIQLLSTLKQQLNLYTKKSTLDLSAELDEDKDFLEPNPDQPAKILIASRESLDHLHKRLKRTLIDFWTQETRINDATQFRNLYPTMSNNKMSMNNSSRSKQFGHLSLTQSINSIHSIDSADSDKQKFTLNQFINHYFQSKSKNHVLKTTSSKTMRNCFNIYSYFDLVDTFLDLRLNGSEQIRDQINEVYLANTFDDELFKDPNTSLSTHQSAIVLWSIGDHTRVRLANRLHLNSVLVAQFILSMLPGSISLFYGDEIGLRNVQNVNTAKFKNGQLVPMAWSSRGLYANFTNSPNLNANEEFISNKVIDLEDSVKSPVVSGNQNAPWLPISIDQLVHRNAEKLQEQIQRIQHLLQFRKQYLSAMNWNLHAYENVHHHQPASGSSTEDPNQAKSVHRTYLFHYVNNGEIVLLS